MASTPPPFPGSGMPQMPPYPSSARDLKYQRRMMRDQAKAQRDQYRYQMRSMRGRSIVGPIMVVLLGVVFLLVETGRLRSDRLWDLYGRWWPLLLILAGAVLLAEWAFDQFRPRDPQQPYVRRRLGGGIMALVILVVLTGVLVSGLHDHRDFFTRGFSINPDNLEQFFGEKHESEETLVEAFAQGAALTIDNPHGDVTVTGTSTDGQAHIEVHKQVYTRSDSDAQGKARQLSPQIRRTGQLLAITLPDLSGATADLTISVPPATGITLTANHGDVHVDGTKAAVTVTANHGDVELSGIAGLVVAHINNSGSSFSAHDIAGTLSLEGRGDDVTLSDVRGAVTLNGDFYGTTHLEHIASGVKFHTSRTDFQLARLDGAMEISPDADLSADQAVGPVVLNTRNRNISLDRVSGDLSVTNRNGSIELTSAPPLGNVTVENRNGSVSLTVPEHASFGVSAETTDGDMQNDFSLPAAESNGRKTLNGTVGGGGSVIHINTSQGDVSVRKASIAPLPVAAPAPPLAPPPPPGLSVKGGDGSSVYVGEEGVRVISGSDGSSVIVGKDGVHITAKEDGSSVYTGKDGTRLTEGRDRSKVLVGRDGTHYTEAADGSKAYTGRGGTTITIDASGHQTAVGPGGRTLTDAEIRSDLQRAANDLRHAEQQRDQAEDHHAGASRNQ